MKWPLFLVLTVAQMLIISAYRRGHGARPPHHRRYEDYDRDARDPDDYEDEEDDYQSPERTYNHRHDGYDREENQMVNAYPEEEEEEEDENGDKEEGPEDEEHEDDNEEQGEDEPVEEDHKQEETETLQTSWDGEPAEKEEREDLLTDHPEGQKKAQPETEIVPRNNWGAEPAKKEFPLELPVKQVWFTYSTDLTSPCRSFKRCARTVLDLQTKCLTSKKLTDIPFNFLIGGDGRVYVGRGWTVQPPASSLEPTVGGNRLDIAFLGNLTRETMAKNMIQAVRSLVDYGIEHNYISPTYSYKEWDKSGVRSKDTGL